jgi:hypothetical protein
LADCISQPNAGIFSGLGIAGVVYGLNGVCHQMANRILSAANVELPLTFAQIRATRLTYRGPFGWNMAMQPLSDHWPNRRIGCVGAPPLSGPIGPSSQSRSSSTTNLSGGSGLMSLSIGGSSDPRSELSTLLEAGLGHPVDARVFDGLVGMQVKLHAEQEKLAFRLVSQEISREQYLSLLDSIMIEAARTGENLLGFDEFHKVFGEFRAYDIVDANAFVADRFPTAR